MRRILPHLLVGFVLILTGALRAVTPLDYDKDVKPVLEARCFKCHGPEKQKAGLRLSAFNQRVTPELNGVVEEIAPDLTTDQKSGASFYTVRLRLDASELRRLGDLKVVPGMPAEAFIQTSSRTILSYLIKPLQDQMERAFRED